MKFELNDDTVLLVSGIVTGGHAIHLLGWPRHARNAFYVKKGGEADESKEHELTARWFGQAMGTSAALGIAVGAAEHSKSAKKNALKACGAAWLAGSALDMWGAREGVQKKEVAYGMAAFGAAMGTLCLWRGFAKDEDEE